MVPGFAYRPFSPHGILLGSSFPQPLHDTVKDSTTQAMLALQVIVLFSYNPPPKGGGFCQLSRPYQPRGPSGTVFLFATFVL